MNRNNRLPPQPLSVALQRRSRSVCSQHRQRRLGPLYIPPPSAHIITLLYIIHFPPGFVTAFKYIQQFQEMLTANCPLIHQMGVELNTTPQGAGIFQLELCVEDFLSSEEELFLEQSKKIFPQVAKITITSLNK